MVPNALQEVVELSQYIDPLPNTGATFYAGAVQDPNAATPGAGWILLDDSPAPNDAWFSGEPDDEDGVENHMYNLAFFDKTSIVRRLFDSTGGPARRAVCECDGIPIAATSQSYIDADPNNPN